MKTLALVRAEFARLTTTALARVALVALILVPVLYGGLYLWANKDPYAGLDRVPAAVVVEDTGTVVDGGEVSYGADVAAQLVDDGSFEWHEVSAGEAAAGVADGTYDFAVTLPGGFSSDLVSASGDDPRQGSVELLTSDTNGFLATTIAGQVGDELQASIAEQVGEEAASTFLTGLSTIRGDLVEAGDGASTLADGAQDAVDGAGTLSAGVDTISTGAHELSDGLATLQTATTALPTQTATLATGAKQVADGNAALAAAGVEAATAAQGVTDDLGTVRTGVEARLTELGLTPEQITAVLAELDPLGTTVVDANTELQALSLTLTQLSTGSAAVATGAQSLADATPALTTGIATAATGASDLAAGTDTAATGAADLETGLGTLRDGANELRDGLTGGAGQIPETDAAGRDLQAATIADPVAVSSAALTEAGDYGAGLAPFFISLAAWIGIYALFLIVKPLSRRGITALGGTRGASARLALAGWLTPALLGAVQMGGLFFVISVLLGFRVDQPAATLAFMALTSMAFAAILLALNVLLGSVGQFVGLILMVVQLVTAGGTFPWQTLPGPLAALHGALPMSAAVDGLRQLMYGGSTATAATDAATLALWLVAGLTVAGLGALRVTRHRTLRDLRPSLIG